MMSFNKKLLLIFFIFLANFLLLAKTKSITLNNKNDYSQGKFENTFINKANQLSLNYPTKKILDIKEDVIWAISANTNKNILISTTPNGKLSLFNQEYKLINTTELSDEITSIYPYKDNYYLGSSLNGIIYKSDLNLSTIDEFVKVDLRFIWSILLYEDSLFVAGGGEQGKIIQINLNSKIVEREIKIEDTKNVVQLKIHQDKLYFSTSMSGRLYSYDLENKKISLYYESKSNEIPDFALVEDRIYLITSGEADKKRGKNNSGSLNENIITDQKNNNSGNQNRAPNNNNQNNFSVNENFNNLPTNNKVMRRNRGFINALIEINPKQEVKVLKELPNFNLAALVFNKKNNQLFIASFENSNIWSYDINTTDLELIYFNPEITLSHLTLTNDEIFFTTANTSELFQMKLQVAATGSYQSRIYDFRTPVYWGKFYYETTSADGSFDFLVRFGNSSQPDDEWSKWEDPNKIKVKLASYMQFKVIFNNDTISSSDNKNKISKITFYYNPLGKSPEIKNLQPFALFKDNKKFSNIKQKIKIDSIKNNLKVEPNRNYINAFPLKTKRYALIWEVDNPDNLVIEYKIYYKQVEAGGSNDKKESWNILKENMYNKDFFLFNGETYFDGEYIFKLEFNDYLSNGELEGSKGELVSPKIKVDNTKPFIQSSKSEADKIIFTVVDKESLINGFKYSLDRKRFFDILPQDKVFDDKEEIFEVKKSNELFVMFSDNENNINYQIINLGEEND